VLFPNAELCPNAKAVLLLDPEPIKADKMRGEALGLPVIFLEF
jgi:hypothetical protein